MEAKKSQSVLFQIKSKSASGKEGEMELSVEGFEDDIINLLARACDIKQVRHILYEAVRLDYEHNLSIGRRYDDDMPPETMFNINKN